MATRDPDDLVLALLIAALIFIAILAFETRRDERVTPVPPAVLGASYGEVPKPEGHGR